MNMAVIATHKKFTSVLFLVPTVTEKILALKCHMGERIGLNKDPHGG